jgi:hypothetical protein
MASISSIRLPSQSCIPSNPTVKYLPPSHFLIALGGALGIGLLGGLGTYLGVWAGGGHWASALAGGLFGLGAGAGLGAGLLLLLSPNEETAAPAPPPADDLWLSDHERWDRLFDRLSRSPQLPPAPKSPRERSKSRPPLAR